MSDLTPEKLAELRRLAEACPMPDNDPATLQRWYELGDLTERRWPIPPIDAAFIVAASPDVVLGLLDRLVPYRPEPTAGEATGAAVTLAAPDAINPPPDPSAAVTEPHSPERTNR